METVCREPSQHDQKAGPSATMETLPREGKSGRHTLKRRECHSTHRIFNLVEGPEWLSSKTCSLDVSDVGPSDTTVPDDCQCEMKRRDLTTSLVTVETHKPSLTEIIDPERYSSSHRLFRVTALVLKFISRLRGRVTRDSTII